jgi:hypothetical protein
LKEVVQPSELRSGTWTRQANALIACVDLPKGSSALELA